MATKYTEEFRRDAVRMAISSGLIRSQVSSDLDVGLSTLNKWVQQHQHDDMMWGSHEDVEKENERLRKEVRLLREEREVLKKAAIVFAGQNPLSWFAGANYCRAVGLGLLSSMPEKKFGP